MKDKTRLYAAGALLCNCVAAVLVWISLRQLPSFRYFTILSNAFAGLCALGMAPFCAYAVVTGKRWMPGFVGTIAFAGTASVTLTLVTVLVFLGPTQGYGIMFAGVSLYLHALVPILSIAATILFVGRLSFRQMLCGCLPALLYGAVYLVCVVIARVWPDFYGFTFGGKAWAVPVSFCAMQAGSYGLTYLLWKLCRRWDC